MDTPIDAHHFRKTKDIHHDHLFARSFQDIDHHAERHIHVLLLACYQQFELSEQIQYDDIFA
jgi:hypothetical protein